MLCRDNVEGIIPGYCRQARIVIPGSAPCIGYITGIGEGTFAGCTGLTQVVLPNSLTSVGDNAFRGCSGLKRVALPSSLTSIGDGAFWNCKGLTQVALPSSLKSVGNKAFLGCSGLTQVALPSLLTSIGDGTFWGCSGLTQVALPSSLTSVGKNAFRGCSGLAQLELPSSLKSVGDGAFSNCSGLTQVALPSSLTSVGKHAFRGCSSLTQVAPPSSLTSIGDNAFEGCSGLVPWLCWGDSGPWPRAEDPSFDRRFEVIVALAAAQLAYTDARHSRLLPTSYELGTDTSAFALAGKQCRARLELRRFFGREELAQIQKLTLSAEVHVGCGVPRRLLVLAFRGSVDVLDWMRNSFALVNCEAFANEQLRVHAGFAAACDDPEEHALLLESLVDNADDFDGLLVTGHSLGGAVAQIATLRVRQLLADLKSGAEPRLIALRDAVARFRRQDSGRRSKVISLLEGVRCVTFEAPMPFAPVRAPARPEEQEAALEWLRLRALNFCCGSDPVPHLPGRLDEILSAGGERAREMAARDAEALVSAYLAYQGQTVNRLAAGNLPEALTAARRKLREEVDGALKCAAAATADLRAQCREYRLLVPTVFMEPGLPRSHFQHFQPEQADAYMRTRLAPFLASWEAMQRGVEMHLIPTFARHVVAAAGVTPPARGFLQAKPAEQLSPKKDGGGCIVS